RPRVGLGRPENLEIIEAEIIAYVRSAVSPAEKRAIDKIIPQVSEAILCLLTEGLTTAMNKFN
ncbi:MAG: hypothetical protein E3J92_04510, partial [Dehalococcoidia bacterium]